MTLLAVVQTVCGRLSLPVPTAVAGSTDTQVIQLMTLANKAGQDLADDFPWQALTEEWTFTTLAQQAQSEALPDDYDRFIPNSFYNRSTRRPLSGPITPVQWQGLMAMPSLSTVYIIWRERQGQFLMTPTPPAGQVIAFEYVSKNWAKSVSGTPQGAYIADSDVAYLDEDLIADSLEWRFLAAKGLPYAEAMETFQRNAEKAMGRDGGSSQLTLTPAPVDLNRVNLPDGSFGQ